MADRYVTDEDLQNRFGYHKANEKTIPMHQSVRGMFLDIAETLNELLPEGREKSLAFTALQEAAMWSNASVACNLATLDLNG